MMWWLVLGYVVFVGVAYFVTLLKLVHGYSMERMR